MTQEQARLVFNMARDAFNAYKREKEEGLSNGNFLGEQYAALVALSAEYGAQFPDAKEDGYFRLPKAQ
jgi:hypothetical protein